MSKHSVLILQLARLGDTVQSLMALRAAKQIYPELEITVVVREKFADAVRRVPWIKEVITFPTASLLAPVIDGKRNFREGVIDLAEWLCPLTEKPWDLLFNWTYSEASSYLTAILPARVKMGYSRRKDGSIACLDGWSTYLQSIVQGEVPQNIHLTDILTTQLLTSLAIHVGEPLDANNESVTSKNFFRIQSQRMQLIDLSKRWVSIQIGAGRKDKAYDPDKLASFSYQLLKRHSDVSISLLGGAGDREREAAFFEAFAKLDVSERFVDRVASHVGDLDFDQWVNLISYSQWLVSGDTAAIHLASVLGTRVLNLSLGDRVRYQETGPYGNGHYVVAPRKGEALSAETVYAVWSYAQNEWSHQRKHSLTEHFDQIGFSHLRQQADVYRSRIRIPDHGGGVVYENCETKALTSDEWSSMVMGQVARVWFCGWNPPIGFELKREQVTPELIRVLRAMDESAEVLTKVCNSALDASQELYEKSSKLRSNKIMRLEEREDMTVIGKKLAELDTLIERLALVHVPFKGFSQLLKVAMHNLRGESISDLSKEACESYKLILNGVELFRAWLKHSLSLGRPVLLDVSAQPPTSVS